LRGVLPAEPPGARGLEHVARNPACKRLRALTIVSLNPATVADKVYKQPAREGMSPFTISVGVRFEQRLFENGAARLLDLYRKSGILGPHESKVVIIPDIAPGTSPQARALRLLETRRLLEMKLRGDPDAPNLIVKPLLPIEYIGQHHIEPDFVRAPDSDSFYRPGEVKSYPDRKGKTSAPDLRSACRQAAVEVVALRQVASLLSTEDPSVLVPALADIILRKPGSLAPSLTLDQAIQGEVFSVERAIHEAPRDLTDLDTMLPPGASLDDQTVLDSIPNLYRPSCREFCPLAMICKQQAVRDGDLVLLGDLAKEELAPAGSIGRVWDLISGRVSPQTPEQLALQQRLRDEMKALRVAIGNAS
jgi:hypothetical protein